jgi:hypothetical protein
MGRHTRARWLSDSMTIDVVAALIGRRAGVEIGLKVELAAEERAEPGLITC